MPDVNFIQSSVLTGEKPNSLLSGLNTNANLKIRLPDSGDSDKTFVLFNLTRVHAHILEKIAAGSVTCQR